MSVRRFSFLVFGLLLCIFLVSSASNLWSLTRSNQSLDNVNKEIRVVLSVIDPINHSRTLRVRLMEAMINASLGDKQKTQASLESAKAVMQKATDAFNNYQAAPPVAGEEALSAPYRRAWQTYVDEGLRPLMDAASANDTVRFNQLVSTTIPQLDRQFEITLDNLLAFREKYAQRLNNDAQSRFVNSMVTLGVFVALFTLIIAAIFILLRRRVLSPLDTARIHCQQMAAGELHIPVVNGSKDEIGEMLGSLEQMRLSLVEIITQVRASSQSVAHAAEEISAGNTDLSARTEEQAASLGQTAASMEQLTSTVKHTSENTQQANMLAATMRDSAQEGNTIVENAVMSMKEIESSSGKIDTIISLIEDIAFQTNILALNAAVEAARAGEQGRGFAVVASEVRNLAQRSSLAAKEIKELIEASSRQVLLGSERVSQAGESMQRIITTVQHVSGLMAEIALSTGEQSRGIEQINQAVAQMDTVTQQNAALVEEASAAAHSLKEQSQVLEETVAVFKLS
ncbi:methyl-accepting chemotaxis protein [Kosakonia oryzendophytica]|uniref:methyl-accepting chemotaxis protein n=1 Tax=Kosakonia TaxID=1330547 RepID=UPI000776E301|nr:methyl-accepting chemotaxis protein [Kosakonia oryzendophytica]AMO48241.1 Methyl-accepting chemotaxis sensory transducer [Enterobacter sp. FY-07]TDT59005.1 methyl-accepting chemotaxis sensory transducer with TarH sensor [Enterobacter sp. AG5470]WBT59890.1 methyl-accepting chemotaxis protein [Kosakonia oryzendophytica]